MGSFKGVVGLGDGSWLVGIQGDPHNQGTVVFHAGSNIAARWEDFQSYSEAD